MNVFYKLIFVDRKTLEPSMKHEGVKPQFIIDIDELWRTQSIVNPRKGLQNVISDDQDRDIFIASTARFLSESYAADVYYKTEDETDWKIQRNTWKRRSF